MRFHFGGGLNERQSPHVFEAAAGSYNFDLSKDSYQLQPRKPFDLEGTAPNAGDVRGIMQLIKRDDTETTLIQAGNTVYRWGGSSTWTSMGSCNASSQLRGCHWPLDDYLVISDVQKLTTVQKWDGTTFGTLTTGLGSSLYAKYAITHLGRVWLFNVSTTTDTPHLLVASVFETPTSYDTSKRAQDSSFASGNEAFYMLTPDLRPINGVALFHGDLIISTKEGRLYKLTGKDSTDFAFVDFYVGSNSVGNETLVNTGNDVMYIKRGGAIESLRATQEYGDVAADDLSRWIPTSTANLSDGISIYDQYNQKVLFFVDDKVLVFYKDIISSGALLNEAGERAPLSPWSVYETLDASSFNTNASLYMKRPGTSTWTVIFGTSNGRMMNLNGTGLGGDAGSSAISMVRKTKLVSEDDGIKFQQHVTRGSVTYRRVAQAELSIKADWGDSYNSSTATVTLKGPPASDIALFFGGANYFGGSNYYGQGFRFAALASHQNFSNVGRGQTVFFTLSSDSNLRWQVDALDIL